MIVSRPSADAAAGADRRWDDNSALWREKRHRSSFQTRFEFRPWRLNTAPEATRADTHYRSGEPRKKSREATSRFHETRGAVGTETLGENRKKVLPLVPGRGKLGAAPCRPSTFKPLAERMPCYVRLGRLRPAADLFQGSLGTGRIVPVREAFAAGDDGNRWRCERRTVHPAGIHRGGPSGQCSQF